MTEDLVYQSLEMIAEKGVDITQAVYENYFSSSPESEQLMSHMDPLAMGKMMEEILRLIMIEDFTEEDGYLNWEVENHEMAYNVEPDMYDPLFTALIETVKGTMGESWNADYEAAWITRTNTLKQEIVGRFSTA